MHAAEVVALAYHYPTPTALAELVAAVNTLDGGAERSMGRFVAEVSSFTLGEWEECHTATLDLSPHFIPYVGHVSWGENYRRGEFMADLKGAMREAEVDLRGELPDHIEPILRLLAASPNPPEDLIEVLPASVAEMRETLDNASPKNPYRHLLAATAELVGDVEVATIGAI
jgi:nitrate reductase delta subunit